MAVSEQIKKKAEYDAAIALNGWLRIFASNSGNPIHGNNQAIAKRQLMRLDAFLGAYARPYHIKDWQLRMERRKAFMAQTITMGGKSLNPFEYALKYAPKDTVPLILDRFTDDYTYVCTSTVAQKMAKNPELKQLMLSRIATNFYFKGQSISEWYNQERLAKIISHFPEIIHKPMPNRNEQNFGSYLLSIKTCDPFVFFNEAIKKSRITPVRFLEFVAENNPEYMAKAVENTASRYKVKAKQQEQIDFLSNLATVYPHFTYDIVTSFMKTSSYPAKETFPEEVLLKSSELIENSGVESFLQSAYAYTDTRGATEKEKLLQRTYATVLDGNEGKGYEKLMRLSLIANYSSPKRAF
ncbi:MAG: hypothetical protein IKD08_00115 [Alphaproteobacteria bacterium]|nr:hypothetical protein [Alphaproteobacteria bacterium]